MKRFVASLVLLATVSSVSTAAAESIPAEDLARLAVPMPRHSLANESIYFVMIDRYANGDVSNDRGAGGPANGFDATNPAYYHGGDLIGLTQNLERIQRLGFTALWITPPFLNNTVQGNSAAYHGYWINDFTKIDPHFGTNEEFAAFVERAHTLGLKVYLDIVMNHTGDVIRYRDGDAFAAPGTKQPYIPDDLTAAKAPSFLNELENFHNQGSISNWSDPDQSRNGDFYGLDDIKTENQVVVDGFAEVFPLGAGFRDRRIPYRHREACGPGVLPALDSCVPVPSWCGPGYLLDVRRGVRRAAQHACRLHPQSATAVGARLRTPTGRGKFRRGRSGCRAAVLGGRRR